MLGVGVCEEKGVGGQSGPVDNRNCKTTMNTSESDAHSYEVTSAFTNKAQKKF